MIIARKLLLPTLFFFALVLVGLTVIFYTYFQAELSEQDENEVELLSQILESQLDQRGDLATALALQAATGSTAEQEESIQQLLLTQDSTRAERWCVETLQRLRRIVPTAQIQLHRAPATFLLQCQYPGDETDQTISSSIVPGTDQTTWRATLTTAIAEQRNISWLEMGPDGLFVRGVAPVVSVSGEVLGGVEIALPVDAAFIAGLKDSFGSDWNILLNRQAIQEVNILAQEAAPPGSQQLTFQPAAKEGAGPLNELALLATTRTDVLYGLGQAYRQTMQGQISISKVIFLSRNYSILSLPLRDSNGATIGVVDIVSDSTAVLDALRTRILGILGVGVLALLIGGVGLSLIIRRILRPVQDLTVAVASIAQGDLEHSMPPPRGMSDDEIKQLYVSFGIMTRQMRGLLERMEQRVVERTQELETRSRQLQTAAEVGRDITSRSHVLVGGRNRTGQGDEMQSLLDLAVRQIASSFDFYQVSLFLVTSSEAFQSTTERSVGRTTVAGLYAQLKAASGETGRKLLQQQLRLDLTKPGIVSWAINNNQSRIVRDVTQETGFVKNPLLPDTRSEIAVPLRGAAVGRGVLTDGLTAGWTEQVIGALDVQSRQVGAFDQNDAATLQIIADQLANAIQNMRMIDQLSSTIMELEQASGELTRQTWQNYLSKYASGTFSAQSQETNTPSGSLPAVAAPEHTVSLPLRVRDQVIGGIDLVFDGHQTHPEVIMLAEEAANRLGLVLESTRLLQEARRLALREQLIGQVAGQVRATLDIDEVMKNAIRSIGEALEMSEVEIRLKSILPAATPSSAAGKKTTLAEPRSKDQKEADL